MLNSVYEHYKGDSYEVLHVGKHTETEERLVIYRKVGGDQVWCRPYDMFHGTVDYNNKTVPRFELQKQKLDFDLIKDKDTLLFWEDAVKTV